MCAAGYTPPTFALVNALALRLPTTDETSLWRQGI
jgi:hypothetical protein